MQEILVSFLSDFLLYGIWTEGRKFSKKPSLKNENKVEMQFEDYNDTSKAKGRIVANNLAGYTSSARRREADMIIYSLDPSTIPAFLSGYKEAANASFTGNSNIFSQIYEECSRHNDETIIHLANKLADYFVGKNEYEMSQLIHDILEKEDYCYNSIKTLDMIANTITVYTENA